ncbi:MAG: type I glyceraldehyde-3-phosphate dehydrogenase [Dehalococcoidia bacterium]
MTSRVAINGLGRIGRAILKLVIEEPTLEVVAVNDLVNAANLAYLLRFDTVYGRYPKPVLAVENQLHVGGRVLPVFSESDPSNSHGRSWVSTSSSSARGHSPVGRTWRSTSKQAHASVVLSAPSSDADVPTVVHGANVGEDSLRIISCASCTTNCITSIVEIIGRRIGFTKAAMTTVHAYTASQSIVDGQSTPFRRGRAAAMNLVPASTGAARATARALPEYAEHFDGVAIRAPIAVGSIADITFVTRRRTTVAEVNEILTAEALTERYAEVMGVSDEPLVSSDIIGDPRASVVDVALTRVIDGDLVKIMSWYDNEWGYANQMLREALSVTGARPSNPSR